MHCYKCGTKMEESINFCPVCGTQNHLATPEPDATDKMSLMNSLSRCEGVINHVFSIISDTREIDAQIDASHNRIADINSLERKIVSIGLSICIPLFLAVILGISAFVASIFNKGLTVVLGLAVQLTPFIIILLIVINWRKRKRRTDMIKTEIRQLEAQKLPLYAKADAIRNTDEYIYAKGYLPVNYFYPEALKMLLYYLRNGQADTMKEALKEYDQYLHRCTMEYEARRTANASERAAHAAERTAYAAEQSARANAEMAASMRAVEQYSASTNFWTIYNALR